MKGLRFEKLQESHLPAVLEIERASESAPWSEASFRTEVDHPHGVFIVAQYAGRIVGFAGAWVLVDEAHVTTVAVEPEARGKGIGRALMVELLARCRERGATCSTLEVRVSNAPALKLYEGLGFVRAAVRRRYYPDNKEDAVVMWRYDLA